MEDTSIKAAATESLRDKRQILDQELEAIQQEPKSEKLIQFLSSLRLDFGNREYEFFKQNRITDSSKKCKGFIHQIELFVIENNDQFPLICEYLTRQVDFLNKIITFRSEKTKSIPYKTIITNRDDIFVNSEFLYMIYILSPNLPEELDHKTARLLLSIIKFIDQAGKNISQSINDLEAKITEWKEIIQTLGKTNSQFILQLQEIIDRISRELHEIKFSGDISVERLNLWTQSPYLSSIISDLAVLFYCENPKCSNYGKMHMLLNCGEKDQSSGHKCNTKYCSLECKIADRKRHKTECVGGIKTKKDRELKIESEQKQQSEEEEEIIPNDFSLNHRKLIEKYLERREIFRKINERHAMRAADLEAWNLRLDQNRKDRESRSKEHQSMIMEDRIAKLMQIKEKDLEYKRQREARLKEGSDIEGRSEALLRLRQSVLESRARTQHLLESSKRKGGSTKKSRKTRRRLRSRRYLKTIWY